MPDLIRRDFLKKVPFGLGLPLLVALDRLAEDASRTETGVNPTPTLADHTPAAPSEEALPKLPLAQVDLGRTGLRVSRLAFGTGTRGVGGHSDQSALGIQPLADLLLAGYAAGINFWDTADDYGTHPHLARALQQVDRDKVVVLTKTMSRNQDRVARDVDRFLDELDTDVLDVVLLHFITSSDWPIRFSGAMEALSQAKQMGKVRSVGVSCHSVGALKAVVDAGWADVVMARINWSGIQMDAPPEQVVPVLAKIHAAGIAIIGMKVLGVGRFGSDVQGAMEFVFNLGTIQAVTIGMKSQVELAENLKVITTVV